MIARSTNFLLAITAFIGGIILAMNYPIGQFIAPVGFLICSLFAFYKFNLFPILLLSVLPIIGFAPWTGWISIEELDVFVLAIAAGGYAKCALESKQPPIKRTSLQLLVFATLMSVSILISMGRGFADAGGFVWGWFQGYDGPMNSLRIGKSFFLALLLIPLMLRLQDEPRNKINRNFALGLAIGLATASLAALWERLAFTDLLNFSSDYRSTALFWEMHVGGAALDGWLLQTFPFAIWAFRKSRSPTQFAISLGLTGMAAYSALTTFSRGVYLALMFSLPLLVWRLRAHVKHEEKDPNTLSWGLFPWTIAILVVTLIVALVFPSGGYRGLLALLGLISVSILLPTVLRGLSSSLFLAGSVIGIFCGLLLAALASLVPKGPYALYAGLLLVSFIAIYQNEQQKMQRKALFCLASFTALLVSTGSVSNYWGGIEALRSMCGAIGLLFIILIWSTFSNKPLWPNSLRWQSELMGTAVVASTVIAVFVGGGYMEERFSSSVKDFEGRQTHWIGTLAMLQTPWDIIFGKGLGRFPANYFFAIPEGNFPGTYQIKKDDGNSSLALVAPRHPLSFGDVLRVSQRIAISSQGPFLVDFKVKANAYAEIHFEVCEKHLLYVGNCAIGHVPVEATKGEWRSIHLGLQGPLLNTAPWYAPRLKMFSLAIGNQSGAAEIDDVSLTNFGGENLLTNGGFANEMQRWFFSSDRDHMPWHAKNLLVNLAFDQGITGLGLFFLSTIAALWKLSIGNSRQHELAPYFSAAILGFLLVGAFDSLMDVPRLAFLYYLVLLYVLSLDPLSGDLRGLVPSRQKLRSGSIAK